MVNEPEQRTIWIPKGGPSERVATVDSKPWRVWTLYTHTAEEAPPKLPLIPKHLDGAFLEDYVHDWNWRDGTLRYYSRVSEGGVWILAEFQERNIDGRRE